jgi:hypothetical protein
MQISNILEFVLIGIGLLTIIEFVGKVIIRYNDLRQLDEENSENIVDTLPDDWIVPLELKYNDNYWYAWDLDGNFITQSTTKELLLIDVMNKLEIPPKRVTVNSEDKLNEDKLSET